MRWCKVCRKPKGVRDWSPGHSRTWNDVLIWFMYISCISLSDDNSFQAASALSCGITRYHPVSHGGHVVGLGPSGTQTDQIGPIHGVLGVEVHRRKSKEPRSDMPLAATPRRNMVETCCPCPYWSYIVHILSMPWRQRRGNMPLFMAMNVEDVRSNRSKMPGDVQSKDEGQHVVQSHLRMNPNLSRCAGRIGWRVPPRSNSWPPSRSSKPHLLALHDAIHHSYPMLFQWAMNGFSHWAIGPLGYWAIGPAIG